MHDGVSERGEGGRGREREGGGVASILCLFSHCFVCGNFIVHVIVNTM